MTNILFEESFKGAALVPSYTSKRREPIAAKRGRAKGRQKEESQRPPKGGEPSEPAYLAAKNLPTYGPPPGDRQSAVTA